MIRSIVANYLLSANKPLDILYLMGDAFYDEAIAELGHNLWIWTRQAETSDWPLPPKNVKFLKDDVPLGVSPNLVLFSYRHHYPLARSLANFWHCPLVQYAYNRYEGQNIADLTIFGHESVRTGIGKVISPAIQGFTNSSEEQIYIELPKNNQDLQIVQAISGVVQNLNWLSCNKQERGAQYDKAAAVISFETDHYSIPVLEAALTGIPVYCKYGSMVGGPSFSSSQELIGLIQSGSSLDVSLDSCWFDDFKGKMNAALYGATKIVHNR